MILFLETGMQANGKESALPHIGPAPVFTLIDQNQKPFSLGEVKGKITVVTFIFTACADTCPVLTAKLASIQRHLEAGTSAVQFAAITVDPDNDTPEVLKKYARAFAVDERYFAFLTGNPDQTEQVARKFAVFQKKQSGGSVDHSFLTSIIDASGTIRVQYLGTRFDEKEFLGDLRSLLAEMHSR
jgi:protein SCO1/2